MRVAYVTRLAVGLIRTARVVAEALRMRGKERGGEGDREEKERDIGRR